MVTRRLREVAGADIAVLVASVGTGNTVVAAADGPGAEQLRGTSVRADGVLVRAMQERAARVIVDASVAEGELGALPDLGIGPLAVLPLAARDEALGALAVGNRLGGHVFDEQDLSMMGDFANQAALVLLQSANQATAHQLAMSEERARIARDLHDHSIQEIFAVGMSLNALAGRVSGPEAEKLMDMVDRLDSAIRSIRGSIFALRRPGDRGPQPVGELLNGLVTELTHGLGFTPRLRVTPSAENRVPSTLFPDLVAVVRESLSNVARHARATQVSVTVDADDELVVKVVDDGGGFAPGPRSSGLANLRERARRRGGTFTVTAGQHGGTTVHWSVPLSQAP
jgi:signal transduction histidine kinase